MQNGTNIPGEQPQTPPQTPTPPASPAPQASPAPAAGPAPTATPAHAAEHQQNAPTAPKPSLVFPIIATVLCWPVGLFAILKAVSARKAADAADTATAAKDARSSKTLSIIATCLGALGWLLSIVVLVVSVGFAASQVGADSPEEETTVYSESLADGPTSEVVFRLTVDKGTATHEFEGTLGGTEFENRDQPDSEFKKSLTKTILVDKDSTDFTVYVFSGTSDVQVSCEIEVDGTLVAESSSTGSTYCDLTTGLEKDDSDTDTNSAGSGDTEVANPFKTPKYVVGDCITTTTTEGKGITSAKIDCASAHDGQVTHVETLPEGDYPGEAAIREQANTICSGDVFTSFIGIPFAESALSGSFMYPQQFNWTVGDRQITCLVHEAGGQTTGSLQGAAR